MAILETLGINTTEIIVVAFLFFLFLTTGLVVMIVIFNRMLWPYKVTIAEAVGNNPPKITRRTRAKLIAFGDGGEEIFLIKKPKKLRAAYGKRIGLRQILWVIGDDGLWYNTDFENFNKKLLQVGLMPVDRDVRLASSSIRRGIEKDYIKKGFMDKYGQIVYFGMFFFAVLVFAGIMWFVFDNTKQVASMNLEMGKLTKDTLEAIANIRSSGIGVSIEPSGFVTNG